MKEVEKKFGFPISSLNDSDLIKLVLAEWVASRMEEIVFSKKSYFIFWEGSVVRYVVRKWGVSWGSLEYIVEIDDRKVLWIKTEMAKLGNFVLEEKGIEVFSFDVAVSKIEELLKRISDAMVAAKEESERVKRVLAEDPRFGDAFRKIFEKRLEVKDEERGR
jgi:hypothetical protein